MMTKKIKQMLSVSLSAAMIFSMVGFSKPAFGEEKKSADVVLTVVHTNDTHSRIEEGKAEIGFAEMAAQVDKMRKDNKNLILLDAGDTFHGLPVATVVKGDSIAKAMNVMGYDAMTAGNHDFNYGYDRLKEIEKTLKFPILSANVKTKDSKDAFKPYMIKEVKGIKVGIFGLSTPETATKTNPKNVEGVTFENPIETSKKMVQELKKENVDMIIALGHIGLDENSEFTSKKIIEAVDGIDLFIDGHSHTLLKDGMVVKNTLIAQTGNYGQNLGVVEIGFKDKKIVDKKASLITKNDVKPAVVPPADNDKKPEKDQIKAEPAGKMYLEPNKAVLESIKKSKDEMKSVTGQVIGKTTVELEGKRENVRSRETNLGNLLADAMKEETKADLAITNGGGIRDSIDVGDITKEEVLKVLPFGSYIITKEVKGEDLVKVLEHATDAYPNVEGKFPQVSGITFKIDMSKEKGSRVADIMVNGQKLDLNKTYVVATSDFIANGGDGYPVFKTAKLLNEFGGQDEVLMNHLKKHNPVAPKDGERVIVINQNQKEVKPAA